MRVDEFITGNGKPSPKPFTEEEFMRIMELLERIGWRTQSLYGTTVEAIRSDVHTLSRMIEESKGTKDEIAYIWKKWSTGNGWKRVSLTVDGIKWVTVLRYKE